MIECISISIVKCSNQYSTVSVFQSRSVVRNSNKNELIRCNHVQCL